MAKIFRPWDVDQTWSSGSPGRAVHTGAALCRRAGLVSFSHVALDGTKIKANASKHKAMSYARMVKAEDELAAEIAVWLERAAALDSTEDAEHGCERRG